MAYEYKTEIIKEKGLFLTNFNLSHLEKELNEYGKENWELVSSFATDLDNNGRKEVVLIFKRKLNEFV